MILKKKLNFYLCDNYQEILQLLGFDYDLSANGTTRDGYGVISQSIFSVMHHEDFSHDIFHYYSGKVNERSNRNWITEEGIAYSWGNVYYTDKNGIIKFSKTKFKSSEDWILEYTISIDKTDKKIILGYDCYKVKIVENRESIMDGWIDGCTYECYVTDELNLPFNCTELIWERVLDKTALEIVYYLNNLPMSKEYKKAIEIKIDVDNDFIKLPIYYQHAIKAK